MSRLRFTPRKQPQFSPFGPGNRGFPCLGQLDRKSRKLPCTNLQGAVMRDRDSLQQISARSGRKMKKCEKARRLWLIVGYSGCGLVALLSLLPAASLPRTGFGGAAEHWLAYAVVGFRFGSGFPSGLLRWISCLALTLGGMAFELLQNFIPGRNPDISGFAASSLGAWSGLFLAILAGAAREAFRNLPR